MIYQFVFGILELTENDSINEGVLMNRLTEKFLAKRNYNSQFLSYIDNAEHSELLGTEELISKLHDIFDTNSKIVVVSDFDMDGIMSGVVGYAGLSELGFDVNLYPCKPHNGYGFDEKDIDKIMTGISDVKAIITCDVGITCYGGCSYAKEHNIDVLVTDHHEPDISHILDADVIVDPCREDERYRLRGICGAHVLWQVLMSYANKYCDATKQEQINRLRVFAGIGTVSDVMPLEFENRELVRDSVAICKLLFETNEVGECFFLKYIEGCDNYVAAFRGLHLVLQKFKVEGKLGAASSITSEFFSYYLSPMFNSVKRMDGDIGKACGVFFKEEPIQQKFIGELWDLWQERKVLVEKELIQLLTSEQPYAPYIYLSKSRKGFNGLFANKLCDKSGQPTLVVGQDADGKFSGSGRSPVWYPCLTQLNKGGYIHAHGHEQAFGVSFDDVKELEDAFGFLLNDVPAEYTKFKIDHPELLRGGVADLTLGTKVEYGVDSIIDIPLFIEFISDLSRLAPFGKSFEAPVIDFKFKPTDGEWKVIGKKHQHLKVSFSGGFDVVMWGQADLLAEAQKANMCCVRGSLEVSDWEHKDWQSKTTVTIRSLQFTGNLMWE